MNRPWRDGLYGYDPTRVSPADTEDPDAVTDEELAAMEAAEGKPTERQFTPEPGPPKPKNRNPERGRTV